MTIKVDQYSLSPAHIFAGTRGSFGFCSLSFEFSDAWDGLGKRVIFLTPSGMSVCVPYSGGELPIPFEVMSERGKSRFAVVGYMGEKKLITVSGELDVLNTLSDEGDNTVAPTESEMAAVLSMMEQAVSEARSVRAEADGGAFRGSRWHVGTAVFGTSESVDAYVEGSFIGDLYLNSEHMTVYRCAGESAWSYIGTILGEKGERGATGAKGERGAKGDKGDKGDIGPRGETGPKGDTGAVGARGERGSDGAAAGFGEPTAHVSVLPCGSEPTVSVSASGDDSEKVFSFEFGLPISAQNGDVKRYSVRFSGSLPDGEREDDALGMVAEVGVGDESVRNDFDSVSIFNRPLCNCEWDSESGRWRVRAYEGEAGFDLYGSNGEVMYECTPFYYKAELSGDASPSYVSVSATPLDGYSLAPLFKNGYDKVYCPCFNLGIGADGLPHSYAGLEPMHGSLNAFMNIARSYDARAHLETAESYFTDCLLLWVEFATKNWQSVMRGACALSYSDSSKLIAEVVDSTRFKLQAAHASSFVVGQSIAIGSAPNGENRVAYAVIKAIESDGSGLSTFTIDRAANGLCEGDCISSRMYETGAALTCVAASSGSPVSNTDGYRPCVWRGKENPWGNGFSNICNVLIRRDGTGSSAEPYTYTMLYLPEASAYSGGRITEDYIESNIGICASDGYVRSLSSDSRYPFLMCPSQTGASSTTYIAAYYQYPRMAVTGMRVGGTFFFYDYCGQAYTLYTGPSDSAVHSAARLFIA